MAQNKARGAGPSVPMGINHLVINVRDMEESHKFWTEVVGLEMVGKYTATPGRNMQFYSGQRDGELNHHDIALVEQKDLPEPGTEAWSMATASSAINHIAIGFPDRESWLSHLEYIQALGVEFKRRVNHGMTHSVYITDPNGYGVELLYELPREVWKGDIDAALNYVETLPTEGAEALEDTEQVPVFEK